VKDSQHSFFTRLPREEVAEIISKLKQSINFLDAESLSE